MTTLADLWDSHHTGPLPTFGPSARYIAPMDCLVYLREDCSYRAVRLNAYQTVLLHPYEDRPVGVKLKGMRFLHHRLQAVLKAAHINNLDVARIGLVAFWEIALTASGDEEVANAEAIRQRQLAQRAKEEIVDKATAIEIGELAEAA